MADHAGPIVETIQLTKTFKDFWGRPRVRAVDSLDLAVQPGEVFGLLGPNGSGKSTTIKILLGLLYPTKGRARVFDLPCTHVKIKSRIGYLPEETDLYRFLDARETLDFYGRLFKIPRPERKRRTEALIDMVGLSAAVRRQVGAYSKGMARRIGLAQALINDPDLLILDEPTSGLDPIGTRQIKDVIVELKKRGKTVILCSHLLADVEDVCDRVAVLYGGKLRAVGTIDELLARQEITQITAGSLDEQTINRIRQIIEQDGREVVAVDHPRDRLEEFFLRIVEQAQREKLETSGADSRRGVSEFLASTTPERSAEEVLASLTATDEAAEIAGTESIRPTDEQDQHEQATRTEVLGSLTADEQKHTPAPQTADDTPSTQPQPSPRQDQAPDQAKKPSPGPVDTDLLKRLSDDDDREDNTSSGGSTRG